MIHMSVYHTYLEMDGEHQVDKLIIVQNYSLFMGMINDTVIFLLYLHYKNRAVLILSFEVELRYY